jgi:hypothetical protein
MSSEELKSLLSNDTEVTTELPEEDNSKINIMLDLDQTLISAEPLEDFPFDKPGIKEKALKFAIHNMEDYYIIFERPHLQDFLDYLFENFNVSVWTAASKDYALWVIDKIVLRRPGRKLDFIFYSYHCDLSTKKCKRSSKDLRMLWKHFKLPNYGSHNTLIIDDLPNVWKQSSCNTIAAVPFEVLNEDSENDEFLLETQNKLEKIKNNRPGGSVSRFCLTKV